LKSQAHGHGPGIEIVFFGPGPQGPKLGPALAFGPGPFTPEFMEIVKSGYVLLFILKKGNNPKEILSELRIGRQMFKSRKQ
jgi:hypothetical protein